MSEDAPLAGIQEVVLGLAKLTPIELDQALKEEAKKLECRVTTLRGEVNKERARQMQGQGNAKLDCDALFPHWIIELAAVPINTRALLDEIKSEIKRHVILSEHQLLVVGLFVMFTWMHDSAVYSPILLVTSPEAGSGKSTLLAVLRLLVRQGLATPSISGPALFRSITKWGPTFVIDEADSVFVENEDLKAIINSGWTRDDGAVRCDSETNEPRAYSTWSAKIVGMKRRKLPDTTLSRCIIIEMKRKKGSERVEDFGYADNAVLRGIRARLARWARDNTDQLRESSPEVPDGFHNRIRANWLHLLAIAELAADERAAQAAARSIERVKASFDGSIGTQLLQDLRTMFGVGPEPSCLLSRDIVEALARDSEKPWAEYNKGKSITQRQLAKLLGGYHIISGTVHPEGKADGKGYQRTDFEDVFSRYLENAPLDASKRPNDCGTGTSDDSPFVQERPSGRMENEDFTYSNAYSDAWTVREAGNWGYPDTFADDLSLTRIGIQPEPFSQGPTPEAIRFPDGSRARRPDSQRSPADGPKAREDQSRPRGAGMCIRCGEDDGKTMPCAHAKARGFAIHHGTCFRFWLEDGCKPHPTLLAPWEAREPARKREGSFSPPLLGSVSDPLAANEHGG